EVAAKNYRLSRCIGLDEEQDFETRVTAWLTAAGIAGAIAKNYALSFWNDGQEIRNAFGRRIFPCLKAAVALKDKDRNASPAAVAKYAEIVTGMMNSNFKSRIEKNFQVNLKTEKDQALEMIRSTPNVPQSAKTKLTAAGN